MFPNVGVSFQVFAPRITIKSQILHRIKHIMPDNITTQEPIILSLKVGLFFSLKKLNNLVWTTDSKNQLYILL